jgi:hypothetical protein
MAGDWIVPRLSASSLNQYVRCPEAWRRSRLLGEREPSSGQQVLGSIVHNTIGEALLEQQSIGSPLDLPRLYDIFHKHHAIESGAYRPEDEVIRWAGSIRDFGDVSLQGKRMLRVWNFEIAPLIENIVDVEKSFELELDDVPVPIVGFVDLVTDRYVVDWKTTAGGKAARTTVDTQWLLQGEIYHLAFPDKEMHWSQLTPGSSSFPAAGAWKMVQDVDPPKAVKWIQHLVESMNHNYSTYGPNEDWPTNARSHGKCWYGQNPCPLMSSCWVYS